MHSGLLPLVVEHYKIHALHGTIDKHLTAIISTMCWPASWLAWEPLTAIFIGSFADLICTLAFHHAYYFPFCNRRTGRRCLLLLLSLLVQLACLLTAKDHVAASAGMDDTLFFSAWAA